MQCDGDNSTARKDDSELVRFTSLDQVRDGSGGHRRGVTVQDHGEANLVVQHAVHVELLSAGLFQQELHLGERERERRER